MSASRGGPIRQLVADVHVLVVAGRAAAGAFGGVDRVDLGDLLIGVGRRFDAHVLAAFARLLAFGGDEDGAVDRGDFPVLVDAHRAQDADDRTAGEFAGLLLDRLQAAEPVQFMARAHRLEPLGVLTGDEHVHAGEQALVALRMSSGIGSPSILRDSAENIIGGAI